MGNDKLFIPLNKGRIISVAFYVLAGILLITAFVSLAASHQNISMQLAQGVPVKGNELVIVNIYLSSCMQYFAFAAILFFGGYMIAKLTIPKMECAEHPFSPVPDRVFNPLDTPDMVASDSEEDDDFEKWLFEEHCICSS